MAPHLCLLFFSFGSSAAVWLPAGGVVGEQITVAKNTLEEIFSLLKDRVEGLEQKLKEETTEADQLFE